MKYIVLLCLMGISLRGSAQSDAAHVAELQQKWANAKLYTMALAEAMPSQQYGFRPVEGEMSFAEQLIHLSSNMVWLSSSYLSTGKPPLPAKELESLTGASKEDILKALGQSLDYAAMALKNLDPNQMNEPVNFFAGPMTKRQILMLMNDHLTHHRAQAIVYLRLNGLVPPKYTGW